MKKLDKFLSSTYSSCQLQLKKEAIQKLLAFNLTRRNGMEQCQRRFRLHIRESFHPEGGWPWNRLPREMVTAQDWVQEAFGQGSQARGVILGAVLSRVRSWTWWSLRVPSSSGNSITLNLLSSLLNSVYIYKKLPFFFFSPFSFFHTWMV